MPRINQFSTPILAKEDPSSPGGSRITAGEAIELTTEFSARKWSPTEAQQLTEAINGEASSFERAAARHMNQFVAVTLPQLTVMGGAGKVLLSWSAPTTRVDGTPLTNLQRYKIYYSQDANDLKNVADVADRGATQLQVNDLAPGTWFFAITALDADSLESPKSSTISVTVTPR